MTEKSSPPSNDRSTDPPGAQASPSEVAPSVGNEAAPERTAAAPQKAKKIALAVAVLGLVVSATWYFAIRSPEPRNDFERFQGTWQLVTAAQGNRSPVTVRVTGDRWVYLLGSQEQKGYRLTLRPEADPKEIDLTQLGPGDQPSAFVLRGIYAFEGGAAKVLVAPDPLPRPTALGTEDDPTVWVLERPE